MNITLTQLQYIVAVDREGSFSKAAKSCHITQPTLSMQVQKIEDVLKVEIFDRTKKPIIATDIGKAIIEQAQTILRESRKIEEILAGSKGEIKGELKVGVIPTIAPSLIPLFIGDFEKKYPDVHLTISEMQTDQIIDALKKDRIDVGILATPLFVPGLVEKPLYYENFNLYLHDDHDLSKKKKIKMGEVDPSDLLLLDEGHCFRDQALQVCSKKSMKDSGFNFTSGQLHTLKKLVDKKVGITLLPELMVRDLSASAKKKVREFSAPAPKREVGLIFGRVYLKRNLINALWEMIRKSVPTELHNRSGEVIGIRR